MVSTIVKISSKYQIAVPSAIRKQLQLQAGDRLIAQVRDGVIVLVPHRADALSALKGLAPDIWEKEDAQTYVNKERDNWDAPSVS